MKIKEKYNCKCIALDANMEMLEIAKKSFILINLFTLMEMPKPCPLKKLFLIMLL